MTQHQTLRILHIYMYLLWGKNHHEIQNLCTWAHLKSGAEVFLESSQDSKWKQRANQRPREDSKVNTVEEK